MTTPWDYTETLYAEADAADAWQEAREAAYDAAVALADAEWARTVAALNGDGGVSIHERADLPRPAWDTPTVPLTEVEW